MTLTRKTTLFFTALAALVVLAIIIISLFSFRQSYTAAAQHEAKMIAEIIRVQLTEAMLHGTIDKRDVFFERLRNIKELHELRVVRSPAIVAQFGPGSADQQPLDEQEEGVISKGKPYFGLTDTPDGTMYRAIIPYKLDGDNTSSCLQCHQVKSNAVLGAITLVLSIKEQRQISALFNGLIIVVIGLFAIGAAMFSLRTAKPLIATAEQVNSVIERATHGDYRGRINVIRDDELGEIGKGINRLLEHLSKSLNDIGKKVANLTGYDMPLTDNPLDATAIMVDCMANIYLFKQAIEEDETTDEIYSRLSVILREEFMLDHFSIYEVDSDKNRLTPVVVDGLPASESKWCDPEILVRADACRAKRTGHTVDSVETPDICNSFSSGEEFSNCRHICIPIIQSGSVGSVVQLVTNDVQAQLLHSMLPFIKMYLSESTPVIESKRLMASLSEQTLTDPMTGLYNRRFLQEYTNTITSYTDRNKQKFAILMADIDFFKKVNDTCGHEAGDAILKQLATLLKESVRSSDFVIRYGGEEFLLLLRDTEQEYAIETAEKIRKAVEKHEMELPGTTIKKTISIGVAVYPDDSNTFWQVVKYADVALYNAKETGRNRVVHFLPEMWENREEY